MLQEARTLFNMIFNAINKNDKFKKDYRLRGLNKIFIFLTQVTQ